MLNSLKLTNLVFFTALCFCANELAAWGREPLEVCKQGTNYTNHPKQCKKYVARQDEDSFASQLTPYGRTAFMRFTPEQRKQALDYADCNKMSPDDAVSRVAGTCF